MTDAVYYAAVLAAIGVFLVFPTWLKLHLRERRARQRLEAAVAAGRHEPATIRPVIDPGLCMGSGACVKACPEDVLQIVAGQARVVDGAKCVGHGACATACPVDAIALVFGSERRGVELPAVKPNFQTNVPGVFIAGELGGMGLIANAVEQGVQAVANASRGLAKSAGAGGLDLVIVGAGPAGLGAGLEAHRRGLAYAVLEQDEFGGALRHFPRQKLVMTRPMDLPGYGKARVHTPRKEALIELFEQVVAKTGLRVDTQERVEGMTGSDGAFVVRTSKRELHTARVVLAIGRRGTPRKLGVPGEELEKVAYRLVDPELYELQHLLVVGGGDSALEAAASLAEQPGNRVTLSYRGTAFNRPKADNLERLQRAEAAGALTVKLGSTVTRIGVDRVWLDEGGAETLVPNDFVFVLAGGVLPTAFLAGIGVEMQTHYGKRVAPAGS
ncbi:MAG: NAD(P)-binding domain-containing protein [Myxococcota bacterium]